MKPSVSALRAASMSVYTDNRHCQSEGARNQVPIHVESNGLSCISLLGFTKTLLHITVTT
jgi:hypothetical protein